MTLDFVSVTTKQLAAIFGVSDARIRELSLEKVLTAIKTGPRSRNRYDLPAAVQAYILFKTRNVGDSPSGQQLQAARRRKIDIDSRLAELKLLEREGELGKLSTQRRKMASDYATVRAVVEQLPDVIFSGLNGSGTLEARVRVDRLIGVAVEAMRAPAGAPKEAEQ
jgi:hypothetical protein